MPIKVLARFVVFASAVALTVACSGASEGRHTPMRPTIEILARSINYDASKVTDLEGDGPVEVTLELVGERLLDYPVQDDTRASTSGSTPAVASFDPPDRHVCCWEPASVALAKAGVSPAPGIHFSAAIDEEAPADLDADQGSPAMQAVGVSLPGLEHVTLPATRLISLSHAGVRVGSPAVAIVDITDPSAPFVRDLRVADGRELASDPSNPPTTALLPETVAPVLTKCPRTTTPTPDRYERTLRALGPAFFHQTIATPARLPRGNVTMQWSVLGPDHVRALFASDSRGCNQDVLIDILPSAKFVVPASLHPEPSELGTLYQADSGLRSVLVYDKIAYDVRGATTFATSSVTRGLVPSGDPALKVTTE